MPAFGTKAIQESNHKNLSGKLRPSGRFSVVQLFRGKKRRPDLGKAFKPEILKMFMLRCSHQPGETWWSPSFFFYLSAVLRFDRAASEPLGSSIAPNSQSRAARGSRGINSGQRDKLCWSANALERIYGKRLMTFATFTLPALSDEDLISVQNHWPEIVHYLVDLIKGELKDVGITTAVVGCTEIQMERRKDTGKDYPHLHLVFRGRVSHRNNWGISHEVYRTLWARSVRRFLVGQDYCWNASENIQPVKRSVGGYLAKYISKCASKGLGDTASVWHPRDWIILGRKLRRIYEELSQSGYATGCLLLDVIRDWTGVEGYKRPLVLRSKIYGERKIGEFGWLKGWLIFPEYLDVHPIQSK